MKKKIIAIAAIGSLVLLTAAYSIFSTEKNQVNSLMLENIEALAQSEGGGSSSSWTCWSGTVFKDGASTWQCGNPCQLVQNRTGERGKGTCYE